MDSGPIGQFEWDYPPRSRIDELDFELRKLSESFDRRVGDLESALRAFSECLEAFAGSPGSSDYQILGWLRVAASFRRRAVEADSTAGYAFGALRFLEQSREWWASPDKVRDLNWVLDRTLDQLGANFQSGWIYNAITAAEMSSIQQEVLATNASSAGATHEFAEKIGSQVQTIRTLKILADATNFDQKLDALVKVADSDDPNTAVARSALTYLAKKEDVVPDHIGILGLLDDLYVIEWAYAVVEEQAYGLPLLAEYQRRFPHLESSYVTASGTMLDRFGQYVVGCAHALLEDPVNNYMVLRDSEAFLAPIVGSAALAAMQENASASANTEWVEGDILNLLNFGESPERVRYLGHQNIAGSERIVVEVRSSGRLYLPTDLASSMEVAPRQDYRTLSNGSAVAEWQKNHSIDPLHFLFKGRPRSDARRAVLVLAPRNLLEHYLPSLHSRGQPIAKLVGASWISATQNEEPLSQSVISRAAIYACASAMVARNLIEDPPPGVVGFDLIVLGANNFREVQAEFVGQDLPRLRTLCLTDISEVPGAPGSAHFLEDEVVLPWSLRPRGYKQLDPLLRALRRQYNRWVVDRRVEVFQNEALASINEFLEAQTDDAGEDFSSIVQQLRRFLADAGRMPRPNGVYQKALKERASMLAKVASREALYDPQLNGVSKALKRLADEGEFAPNRLWDSIKQSATPLTILCRSRQEAQETTELLRAWGIKGAGLTANELFQVAPVENLLVPGWHGAETMRRLDTAYPAVKLNYNLYDFQERWFDRVMGALRKRAGSYDTPIKAIGQGIDSVAETERLIWPTPTRSDPVKTDSANEFVPPIEIRPDLKGVLDQINRGTSQSDEEKVTGIPVVLDDFGTFMFLPPHASLVLLDKRVRRPEDACISVSQLRAGDVFILKDGSHRDLFQELAPNYLQNPEDVLHAANVWRKPLIEARKSGSVEWKKLCRQLADAGLKRTEMAYRNWVTGDTIAPLNYREVIPLLCSLSEDQEVKGAGEFSVQAVTALYEARHKAAAHVFEQLLEGEPDREGGTITIQVGQTSTVLNFHFVEHVGDAAPCPRSMLWQPQKLGQEKAGPAQ